MWEPRHRRDLLSLNVEHQPFIGLREHNPILWTKSTGYSQLPHSFYYSKKEVLPYCQSLLKDRVFTHCRSWKYPLPSNCPSRVPFILGCQNVFMGQPLSGYVSHLQAWILVCRTFGLNSRKNLISALNDASLRNFPLPLLTGRKRHRSGTLPESAKRE